MTDKKLTDKSILNCCPNCRCSNLKYVRIVSRRLPFWWYIECWNCHYCGKTKLFLKRAIKSWNKEMKKKWGKRKRIKKLTDSEIVKALKTLLELVLVEGCLQRAKTISNALDLINRQKEEIERLKNALTDHEYGNCVAVKNGLIYTHTLEDYDELIGDISAKAYKEFAERLKETIYKKDEDAMLLSPYSISLIDNLLKELIGE